MPLEGSTNFAGLKKAYAKGIELRGKTIGIVGFGRIGRETAKIALGLGLAYFGAKDPASAICISWHRKYNVPCARIEYRWILKAAGTLISKDGAQKGIIRAMAAKDNITAIHIHSSRMLLAYGFLRKVFEIFERYKTPIDMITTSEVAVSLSIDDTTHLADIIKEVEDFGTVSAEWKSTIVCVVGDFGSE
ncbi:hypothetical protein FQR65_LT17745 [Abscondita terminalis]|nr:hypothetical protein FQR65_LT17745 [Abscondita terminalis]